MTETTASIFPDDPPRFLPRTPYGYHDVAAIQGELASAGFADSSVNTLSKSSEAPSPRYAAVAYCEGTPLRNEIEARDENLLDHVTQRATEAIEQRFGSGPVVAKIQAHVVTAMS